MERKTFFGILFFYIVLAGIPLSLGCCGISMLVVGAAAMVYDAFGGPYYEIICIEKDGFPISYRTEFYDQTNGVIRFRDENGVSHTCLPPYTINEVQRDVGR